jgi:hypothetical protein
MGHLAAPAAVFRPAPVFFDRFLRLKNNLTWRAMSPFYP